jgi:hypothetical protein
MSMTKLLYGLAVLPLLAGVAFAAPAKQSNDGKGLAKQPMQLSNEQMDKVTAGIDFWEKTISDESLTVVSLHEKVGFQDNEIIRSTANPPAFQTCTNVSASCQAPSLTNPNYAGTNFIGGSTPAGCTAPGCSSPYFIQINNPSLSVAAAFR